MNKFTNTTMLASRIASLKKIKYNIEHWMFSHTKLSNNMTILDIGCGTGKQIDYLDTLFTRKGWKARIVAIDKSRDSLDIVKSKEYKSIEIKTINCSIDDAHRRTDLSVFDLIYSVYAIYYSSDVTVFIDKCLAVIKNGTQCVFVGNGYGSNCEFVNLIHEKYSDEAINVTDDFIFLGDFYRFANEKIISYHDRLYNQIYYTKNDFFMWWKNHPWYEKKYDPIIDDMFDKKEIFSLSKNNLMLYFCKIE